MRHFARECRANIEIITAIIAQCRICGQLYRRIRYYGRYGWQRVADDNRLDEYNKADLARQAHCDFYTNLDTPRFGLKQGDCIKLVNGRFSPRKCNGVCNKYDDTGYKLKQALLRGFNR